MNTLNIFHSEFDCVLQLHPPTFLVDLIDRSLSEVQALYVSSTEILLDLDGGKKLMTWQEHLVCTTYPLFMRGEKLALQFFVVILLHLKISKWKFSLQFFALQYFSFFHYSLVAWPIHFKFQNENFHFKFKKWKFNFFSFLCGGMDNFFRTLKTKNFIWFQKWFFFQIFSWCHKRNFFSTRGCQIYLKFTKVIYLPLQK
jgi:hypothetical protein